MLRSVFLTVSEIPEQEGLKLPRFYILITIFCFYVVSITATAMDAFEYQVYDAEINKIGEYSLETHLNTAGAREDSDVSSVKLTQNHLEHLTFEFARGMTKYWEMGFYIQSALDVDRIYRYAGVKLRSKLVLPTSTFEHWRFGINFEIANVPPEFEIDEWGMEMRPIISYAIGRWIFTINPIVDVSLTSGSSASPDFAPATKVTFDTNLGFGLGLEYYTEFGEASDLAPLTQAEQYAMIAYDLLHGPIELNLAAGAGLNGESSQWIAKGIFGFDF